MSDEITADDIRAELVRQNRDPAMFSTAEIEQLAVAATDLVRLTPAINDIARAVTSVAESMVELMMPTFRTLLAVLDEYAGYMPGPEFRRARKRRQLAEHRARVAARVPAWKR